MTYLKIALTAALLSLGGPARGAAPLAPGDPDYDALNTLQKASGSPGLPGEVSRKDFAATLVGAAGAASSPSSSQNWTAKDYDALFALLQKYRDELLLLGFTQDEVAAQLAALKARTEELNKKLDNLFPLDGLKIHGTVSAIFADYLSTGPGKNSGKAFRNRSLQLEGELDFSVTRGPMSAMVDMYLAGAGVNRRILLELRTPVVLEVGDLYPQLSSLTLWRNHDEQPYEAEPFVSRRRRIREHLLLKDHRLRIRGARASTQATLTQLHTLDAEFLYFKMADAGGSIGGSSVKYATFLYGGQLRWSTAKVFSLAYNGTFLRDMPDTAAVSYSAADAPHPSLVGTAWLPFSSDVNSGALQLHTPDKSLGLQAEYAVSNYANPNDPLIKNDPDLGYNAVLKASAAVARAHYRASWLDLQGHYRRVEKGFISAPSQVREEISGATANPWGPFPHEGLGYDPTTQTYSGAGFPGSLTSFDPAIRFPGKLAGYNKALNSATPYGDATPNRGGYGADLTLKLFKQGLKPSAAVALYEEVKGNTLPSSSTDPLAKATVLERYTVARAGLSLDLEPWLDWPLSFSGGWTMLDDRNDHRYDGKVADPSKGGVAFTSTAIDAGAQFRYGAGSYLGLGYKHLDYNGFDPSPDFTANFGAGGKADQVYDLWAAVLRHSFDKGFSFEASYGTQVYDDLLARKAGLAPQYQFDELMVRMDAAF